ncbi:acyltransferase family protein [Neolewinella litorea]|uniref:Acyltransferase n=1 Tax=Neolewinella litorea TaxID=2562452 RepID=A0A4S4NPU8_9BACT|nr:acyltransferase [Neolewinella litorea]THH40431.1 acyltransferase [Neolewinella litorea]
MRIHKIDLLRAIGLFMIVAAHLSPPALLHQLRNFDVPLMVLVSGASLQLSHRNRGSYLNYIWKRIKRLVAPVWLFLTLWFLLFYLVNPSHPYLDAGNLEASYLLSDRVQYLWIIRVFLLVALIAPFLYRINHRIRSHTRFFALLLAGIVGYHLLRYNQFEAAWGGVFTAFTESALYYLLPYGLVYLLGMRLVQLPGPALRRVWYFFAGTFLLLAMALALWTGALVPTQSYKYPVAYYYLSYAMMVSVALWIWGDRVWALMGPSLQRMIFFVSNHSIWIYLWHIPAVRCTVYADLSFFTAYPLTLMLAIAMTWLQVRVINRFLLPRFSDRSALQNIRLILLG